jgi:hypothetical protein
MRTSLYWLCVAALVGWTFYILIRLGNMLGPEPSDAAATGAVLGAAMIWAIGGVPLALFALIFKTRS